MPKKPQASNKGMETLKALISVAQTKDNVADFVTAFKKVIEIFATLKAENEAQVKQMNDWMSNTSKVMQKRLSELKDGEQGERGEDGFDGKPGATGPKGEQGESIVGPPGKDGSPDTSEDIRNKLELLEGDDRLDISAIKGLDRYEDRIGKLEARPVSSGWSAAGGGRIMKYYDLSSQLNGVLTSFTLPAFWRIISVMSSSQPNPMRETVDYTVDGTLMKITFTATVDPGTTLAQPQTLLILYAEA